MTDFAKEIMRPYKPSIDSDQLRIMGKQAAARFVNDKEPLDSSIRTLAKEASLNPEQVKRVVEQANVSTYLEIFKSGYDKNIGFPVADAEKILAPEAREKTASALFSTSNHKYIPGEEYNDVYSIFAVETEVEKVAAPEWSFEENRALIRDRALLKNKVADIRDLGSRFEEEAIELKQLISDIVREGGSFEEATKLAASAGMGEKLLDAVFPDCKASAAENPNMNHPIYKLAGSLAATAELYVKAEDEMVTFVKSASDKARPILTKMLEA